MVSHPNPNPNPNPNPSPNPNPNPSPTLGLRVLERCRFNRTAGWELAGKPRLLLEQMEVLQLDTKGDGTHRMDGVTAARLRRIGAFKQNDWGFINGMSDQGFIWYMLFVRHRAGVYFSGSERHKVIHWWGGGEELGKKTKAWEGTRPAENIRHLMLQHAYLQRIDPESFTRPLTPHGRRLRRLRADVEASPALQRIFGSYLFQTQSVL